MQLRKIHHIIHNSIISKYRIYLEIETGFSWMELLKFTNGAKVSIFVHIHTLSLTLLLQGGHNVPALFWEGYFSMKKGSRDPKFLDFSYLIINFQKIKKMVFQSVLGVIWKVWAHCAFPALELHSKALHN